MAEDERPDPPVTQAETVKAEVLADIRALIRAEREGNVTEAQAIEDLPPTERLAAMDQEQTIGLKRRYALAILAIMGVQIVIADGVFVAYAEMGVDWKLPSAVILGWLSATVIEVIGVVLVITRSLFPVRGGG